MFQTRSPAAMFLIQFMEVDILKMNGSCVDTLTLSDYDINNKTNIMVTTFFLFFFSFCFAWPTYLILLFIRDSIPDIDSLCNLDVHHWTHPQSPNLPPPSGSTEPTPGDHTHLILSTVNCYVIWQHSKQQQIVDSTWFQCHDNVVPSSMQQLDKSPDEVITWLKCQVGKSV